MQEIRGIKMPSNRTNGPFKYKALTIYHHKDGPLVFSFCPWAEKIGADQIVKSDIAVFWNTGDNGNWQFTVHKPGVLINKDEVDWSTVAVQ
jgi:hypothetical protein